MIFDRIVCGVDGSPPSLDAARQAARLNAGRHPLVLVAAVDGWNPMSVETGAAEARDVQAVADRSPSALEAAATATLDRVRRDLLGVPAETRLVQSWAPGALLDVAAEEHATLVAVGMHGRSRAAGILLGSVATTVLHEAPCSVLLARAAHGAFPGVVVVGVDQASASGAVARAVEDLADRLGADVRPLAATGDVALDAETVRELEASHREVFGRPLQIEPRPPVDALVDAAADAGLLVVGSRGLHGLRSLGSVSERVAHRAPCSVLVVREPRHRPAA